MSLTLYTVSGAPRGWRVLMGLALKGLEYETQYLQASKGDHKAPEFLRLNPRGTVPVLTAGNLVLRDSIGILAWLDRRYPAKPLFGKTPQDAAVIWQATLECCDYLRAASHEFLGPVFSGGETPPAADSDAMTALRTAADKMHAECRFLEALLADRPFLAGAEPSAADAVAFPGLRLVRRAVETKHEVMAAVGFADPPAIYPQITTWMTRISDLPGVDQTLPIHWSTAK